MVLLQSACKIFVMQDAVERNEGTARSSEARSGACLSVCKLGDSSRRLLPRGQEAKFGLVFANEVQSMARDVSVTVRCLAAVSAKASFLCALT